jgi:2-methylcitrate dehydratase
MDRTTQIIAEFTHGLRAGDLAEPVTWHAKRRLVDTLGCAIGAIDAPPVRIARGLAVEVTSSRPATVLGSRTRTSVELAAFANTAMVRYLDYNDMFFARAGGGGHPSDLIPTALAVGESVGRSGTEVLSAVVAGYEVFGRLASAVRLRELGWDQGIFIVVAAAMEAGKLLGLTVEQLGHAVGIAVVPNIVTRAARVGELSMWKGCATAGAARNGINAALLASRGMTGPPEPFECFDGIMHRVTGRFELDLDPRPEAYVIEGIHTKYRPAEYNAQGPLDLILRMREKVDLAAIERIDVATYALAYTEIGREPAKWSPRTRETADHSLPYLLAVALVDGAVTLDSFSEERLRDERLHELMRRIHVTENPDYTSRFPAELLTSISIRLAGGRELSEEIAYPKGHTRHPMTDAEIDAKFDELVAARPAADAAICADLKAALWRLETVDDIGEVLAPLGELSIEDEELP